MEWITQIAMAAGLVGMKQQLQRPITRLQPGDRQAGGGPGLPNDHQRTQRSPELSMPLSPSLPLPLRRWSDSRGSGPHRMLVAVARWLPGVPDTVLVDET